MTAPLPTRITIEVTPGADASKGVPAGAPIVRVLHATGDGNGVASARSDRPMPGEPREDVAMPAPYDPGECMCLDGDCGADHAND